MTRESRPEIRGRQNRNSPRRSGPTGTRYSRWSVRSGNSNCNGTSRRESYESERVTTERDDESEPVSSVRAAPASDVTGDRVAIRLTETTTDVKSVLRALWVGDSSPIAIRAGTSEETEVRFHLYESEKFVVGFGEDSPSGTEATDLLLARGERLPTVLSLVETYDEFY